MSDEDEEVNEIIQNVSEDQTFQTSSPTTSTPEDKRKRRKDKKTKKENNAKIKVKIALHRREACGKDKRDGKTQKKD